MPDGVDHALFALWLVMAVFLLLASSGVLP